MTHSQQEHVDQKLKWSRTLGRVHSMLENLEKFAEYLIPYRKWFLIFTIVGFFGFPCAFLIRTPNLSSIAILVSACFLVWSWCLFLITVWFGPDKGQLILKTIRGRHPWVRWFYYISRYWSPIVLLMGFLTSVVFLILFILTVLSSLD